MEDTLPGEARDSTARWLRAIWPWNALVWAPLIALVPATSAGDSSRPLAVWLGVVIVVALFVVAVLASVRATWRARHVPEITFVALLAAVVAGSALELHEWFTLFVLTGLASGAAVRVRLAPLAILLATATGVITVLATSGSTENAVWNAGLTTFLSGAATLGFRHLAVAVTELDRTRTKLAQTAVADERMRFARDLHDLLGHTLSVIVVKAEAARRLAERDPQAAAVHAGEIEEIGRRALGEVREAVTGYRDAALEQEVDRARAALRAAGVECELRTTGVAPDPEAAVVLGWVLREGVTNVIRHAGAGRCVIDLRHDGDAVRLEITDDGTGRPAVGTPAEGSGLRGLRERLAGVGGTLDAAEGPDGFRLTAEIPARTTERV